VGSEAHPASQSIGTRGPFERGKVARGDDDYSPPPSAEVKTAILPVHYTPS
jgi:hypothetical protein